MRPPSATYVSHSRTASANGTSRSSRQLTHLRGRGAGQGQGAPRGSGRQSARLRGQSAARCSCARMPVGEADQRRRAHAFPRRTEQHSGLTAARCAGRRRADGRVGPRAAPA